MSDHHSPKRGQAGTVGFILILAVGLILPQINGGEWIIPQALTTQLARNSEAFSFTILVVFSFWLVSDGSGRMRALWILFLIGLVALLEVVPDLDPSIGTHGEPALAALLCMGYLQYTRVEPKRDVSPIIVPGVMLALVVLGELPISGWESLPFSSWLVDNAETWAFAALTTTLIDLIIPFPWGSRPRAARWAQAVWVVGLIVTPLLVAFVNTNGVDSVAAVGPFESALVWVQRVTEAFLSGLLLTLYAALRTRAVSGGAVASARSQSSAKKRS